MIYVIVVVVLVVLILGAVLVRRRGTSAGVSYAPDSDAVEHYMSGGPIGAGPLPEVVIPSPEVKSEEMAHDASVSDETDDLLDPRNPGHAQWLKEHPEMRSDEEAATEENPS
ncbi:MAG: hypothetical protein ABSA07_01265 [Acidimicrobiales bacterium]|jgi:hypothetical protein